MRRTISATIGFSLIGTGVLAIPTLAIPALGVAIARRISPEVIFAAPAQDSLVALTIDDGPSTATAEIMEVLEANDAHATFFVIGENVNRMPETAKSLVAEGHEIAHHMMRNEPSIRLSPEAFQAQFHAMDRILDELGGVRWFRPGSGWYNDRMLRSVAARGYRLVLGSVYPFDAQLPFPAFAARYVRNNVTPGSIIVLHDGPTRGRRTAAVLRTVLPELRSRGYRIVTVSQLVAPSVD
jgi:peptidoglycan/xylan/chitin deacetylase (PgdA/CDA1 family)